METHEPKFTGIEIGNETIDCPKTEHEWLHPTEYVGKHIVWYMAKHIFLEDFVSRETINKFFHQQERWAIFDHIITTATGYEFLNMIDNSREYITDLDLQERLIRTILTKASSGTYDIFVKMTKDPSLKLVRHNIWNFLK